MKKPVITKTCAEKRNEKVASKEDPKKSTEKSAPKTSREKSVSASVQLDSKLGTRNSIRIMAKQLDANNPISEKDQRKELEIEREKERERQRIQAQQRIERRLRMNKDKSKDVSEMVSQSTRQADRSVDMRAPPNLNKTESMATVVDENIFSKDRVEIFQRIQEQINHLKQIRTDRRPPPSNQVSAAKKTS